MKLQILFDRVNHGFCDHPLEYPWTSYLSCISVKPTKLQREKVIGCFNEKAEFVTRHNEKPDLAGIEDFLNIGEMREVQKTDKENKASARVKYPENNARKGTC